MQTHPYIIYTLTLLLPDYIHRRRNPVRIVGAPVSMRTHKVGTAMRNLRPIDCVRSLCAQSGCANHRKFNSRPSLTQFLCRRIPCLCVLQTGSGVLTFHRIVAASYPNTCPHCLNATIPSCNASCNVMDPAFMLHRTLLYRSLFYGAKLQC